MKRVPFFLAASFIFLFNVNAIAAGCNVATFSTLTPPGDATNVVIDSATVVSATLTLPTYCSVKGRLDTASTSVINFEVRLPTPWNNKFFEIGTGGFAGNIATSFAASDATLALSRNFVISATDTGHVGSGNATWALNNPLGILNYGHRAVHLTALVSKDIIAQYYGQPSQHSYFLSCSNGGRQGLMEAQRYPTDFTGIIAGAPELSYTNDLMKFVHNQQAQYPDGNFANPVVPSSKLSLLSTTVLNKCDALDGIKDGIINDPRKCNFKAKNDLPKCPKDVDGPTCFTSQQIGVIDTIYSELKAANKQSYPGYLPGAEYFSTGTLTSTFYIFGPAVAGVTTAHPLGTPDREIFLIEARLDNLVTFTSLLQPVHYLDFDLNNKEHIADLLALAPILNADNPDLSAYKDNGGKLLMYQGWNDPALSPLSTIDYYKHVSEKMNGLKKTQDFARLFMAPGMLHCSTGPGPDTFDRIQALDNWVVNGVAPDSMVATNLTTGMSRPLCPYPQKAVLNDGLDATNPSVTNNAANFHCVNGDWDESED